MTFEADRYMHDMDRQSLTALRHALASRDISLLLQACDQGALAMAIKRPVCPLVEVCCTLEGWDASVLPPLVDRCTADGVGVEPDEHPLAVLLRQPQSARRDHALIYLCERGADLNREVCENPLHVDGPRVGGLDSCQVWLYGLLVTDRLPLEAFDKARWRALDWASAPPDRIMCCDGRQQKGPAHPLAVLCSLWGDDRILTPLEGIVTPERAHRAVAWLLSQGLSWDDPWEDSTVLDVWSRAAPLASAPYALAHRLANTLPLARADGGRPRM